MRKLTLDEAAVELQIKKASVYKRTQRHTLPYTIEPDGEMYVYLDNETTDRKNTYTTNSNGASETQQRAWWDYAAGVSGLVVLCGALIYALGLFALWAPIARTYTHDVVTAWHATSLAPKTVVAGLGVRQLVAFPLLMGIVVLTVILLVGRSPGFMKTQSESADESADEPGKASSDTTENNFPGRFAFFSPTEEKLSHRLVSSLYCLILLFATWRVTVSLGPPYETPFAWTFLWTLLILVQGVGGAYCIGFSVYRFVTRDYAGAAKWFAGAILAAAMGGFFWWAGVGLILNAEVLHQPSRAIGALINMAVVAVAAAIVYYGAVLAANMLLAPLDTGGRVRAFSTMAGAAFIAAFMLTVVSQPPLPRVEITATNQGADQIQQTDDTLIADGTLLTHMDGFWYVFEERKDKSGSRLVAIHDDQVKKVRVVR